MKNLFVLLVLLVSSYAYSQTSDGAFAWGYTSGFKKSAGFEPKVIPANATWQTLESNRSDTDTSIGFNGKGVQMERSSSTSIFFQNGFKQGEIDGRDYVNTKSSEKK